MNKLTARTFMTGAALWAAMALAGCQQETENSDYVKSDRLEIETSLGTRSLEAGPNFAPGKTIGVFLCNPDGSPYKGITAGNENVPYFSEDRGTTIAWVSNSPIILYPSAGKTVAYYPYNDAVSNMHAIPVDATTQEDYMYSGWVEPVSSNTPKVTYAMKHALSVVKINISKGTYSGTGAVSKISIKSTGLATSATLDATTGVLSAFHGENTPFEKAESFTLAPEKRTFELMAVPNGTKADLNIQIEMDGDVQSIKKTPAEAWAKGTLYELNIVVNDYAQTKSAESPKPMYEITEGYTIR